MTHTITVYDINTDRRVAQFWFPEWVTLDDLKKVIGEETYGNDVELVYSYSLSFARMTDICRLLVRQNRHVVRSMAELYWDEDHHQCYLEPGSTAFGTLTPLR